MRFFIFALVVITVFAADQYYHPDVSLDIHVLPEKHKTSIMFAEWIDKFRDFKIYSNLTLYRYKYDVFLSNLIIINKKQDAAEYSFELYGLNYFADLTHEEFIDGYTCLRDHIVTADVSYYTVEYNEFMKSKIFIKDFHKSIDWRDNTGTFVSAVRTQTKSTCWAIPPIQMLEGMVYRRFGEKYDINEDLVKNCLNNYEPPEERLNITHDNTDDSETTSVPFHYTSHEEIIEYYRSLPDLAFQYLAGKGKSVLNESDIGEMINHDKCQPLYDLLEPLLRGYRVLVENEFQIMTLVSSIGPVVAGIYVSSSFQLLLGKGVFDPDDTECPRNSLITHVVLIVGYGRDKRTDKEYWLIKNSWGTGWGDEGYAKVVRNKNACSIASYIAVPELFCECPFKTYEIEDKLKVKHEMVWPFYKKCKSNIEGCYAASRRPGTYQQYIQNETIDVDATKQAGIFPDLDPAFDNATLETETCKDPTSGEDVYSPGHVDTIRDCTDPRLWHERGAMWFSRNSEKIYIKNVTRNLSEIYPTSPRPIIGTTIGPNSWDWVKVSDGSLVRKHEYDTNFSLILYWNNLTQLRLVKLINASYIVAIDEFETTTWEPYFITENATNVDN